MLMDSFLSCINVLIFLFPLKTLQYTESNGRATHKIFCVPDVKNKKSLNPILYYIANVLG